MKFFSILISVASLVGLGFVIVKNVISIIQTYRSKKNKSSQDNKGGDN